MNLGAAEDAFSTLINKSIRALIRGIESKMEPCFTEMLKINWSQMSSVEDQPPYLTSICQILSEKICAITAHLNTSYVRLLCNKFVVYFMRRFLQQFYKCKRISEQGCQQLLLDLQHLRRSLQGLPNEGRFFAPISIRRPDCNLPIHIIHKFDVGGWQ